MSGEPPRRDPRLPSPPYPVRAPRGSFGAPPPRRGRADLVVFVLAVVFGGPAIGVLGFVIAAVKRHSARLGAAAALYGAAGLAGAGADTFHTGFAAFGALWLVMSIHAVVLASQVSGERARAERGGPAAALPAGDPQAAATAGWDRDRTLRTRALALAARNPHEALDLLVGRIDLPLGRRAYPDGGLVDVNNVAPDRLVHYLGLGLGARQFAATRADVGGFDDVADLCAVLSLAPQQLDAVGDRLVFLPMLPWSRTAGTGAASDDGSPAGRHSAGG